MSGSYSYSSTGSYTGDDDSYYYSYSDSATEEKVKGHYHPTAGGRDKKGVRAPTAKSVPAQKPKADTTDSDDYSYPYSDPSLPPQTRQPENNVASKRRTKAAAVTYKGTPNKNNINASEDDYTCSDSYDDYSYSDSESEPQRRSGPTPTPDEVAGGRKGPLPAAAVSSGPLRQAGSKIPAAASAANEDTGSSSYSYSYPEGQDQRVKKLETHAGASESYYSYSDDYGSSYSYTDDGSYYTNSYSYTGDSSYYYSSSVETSHGGKGAAAADRGQKRGGNKDEDASAYYYSDAYSDEYYAYSDSYSFSGDSDYYGSSYYYSEVSHSYEDSYYYSGSATSSLYYYYDKDEDRSSEESYKDYYSDSSYSYTDNAGSKAESSTTSSYGYTSSNPSVMTVTENEEVPRHTVVLRAPAKDTPHTPAAPRRCFVAPKSVEDSVWAFLQRLMRLQQTYEARRVASAAAVPSFVQRMTSTEVMNTATAATASGGPANTEDKTDEKDKKRKDVKKTKKKVEKAKKVVVKDTQDEDEETSFIPTKDGCFSARSLRIAFQTLRFNHLERSEALKNAPVPLPMETMFDIYNTCVAARAKEKVAQAFLAHDSYRSGEIALSVMCRLLRRLGLGTSPVMQGFRISLAASSDTVPEMVMNVEQLVQTPIPASAAAATEEEKELQQKDAGAGLSSSAQPTTRSLQWEVTPVYVARIVQKNAAAKKSTPVKWEHNTVYMGRHAIIRNVASEALFERLKTYIEAATYLCVLTNIFTIHDGDRGTVTVQYPQFVRSVLLAEPPVSRHAHSTTPAPSMKLLAIETLFRAVFHPMEVLHSFEAGRGFPRYLHDWAVESTLHPTNDTEEKRRRNVVPGITADNARFVPTPSTRPPTEKHLSFVLQKVRVPGRPPANARCFCLVSAITAANVFLPAVEVPVRDIVKSSKDAGGYTWVFYSKKHPKKEALLHFAGPATDRVYVECCYETRDPPLTSEEEEGAAAGGGTVLTDTEVATVWCAGYAVFAVEGAKTAALSVSMGSLLQGEHKTSTSATPQEKTSAAAAAANPKTDSAAEKTVEPSKGFLCAISRLSKRKKNIAPEKASNIKIEVVNNKKPIAGIEKLPARFIAYQRHVPMIAELRTAVEIIGKETANALQAFRQQTVRYIFAVAADAALLDQLCTLWAYRTKHWSKMERKDEKQQRAQLLNCVAALYALNNCCSGSKEQFAQALVKERSLRISLDASAPLLPVQV